MSRGHRLDQVMEPTPITGRRSRRWIDLPRHVAFLAVLAGFAIGATLLMADRPFRGLAVVGVTLLLASAARAVLPARLAGLLVNRSRHFDTAALGLLGACILALLASLHATAPR